MALYGLPTEEHDQGKEYKSYLLTILFNAGSTMDSYYRAMVNYDMPQFAE